MSTGLAFAIVGVIVVVAALASARNRRPTPRSSWIVLAAVVAIVAVLGVILANRPGL